MYIFQKSWKPSNFQFSPLFYLQIQPIKKTFLRKTCQSAWKLFSEVQIFKNNGPMITIFFLKTYLDPKDDKIKCYDHIFENGSSRLRFGKKKTVSPFFLPRLENLPNTVYPHVHQHWTPWNQCQNFLNLQVQNILFCFMFPRISNF